MNNYKKVNIIVGWLVFAIALITYTLTLEPTVSLWDCGEFISSSFKLEVGHPPGAPLFMMIGRLFAIFGGTPQNAAVAMNFMSGLASAFTILFLFWTITHLVRKMFVPTDKPSLHQIIAIIGSGAVGALAYTFSDTFWFSAVEAEVYGMSSFFTAIVFWAILKWENEAHKPFANRWIILIAYLMGLSIGVHLLNLLTIPAIVLVYYFKKYDVTRNGLIKAILTSFAILLFVMYGIIPGLPSLAGAFEMMFVNGFGLPFHTGVLFFFALIIVGVVFALRYTYKKRMVVLNTITLALVMILIGYSSFAIIVIRSEAKPPMNENTPDNVYSLKNYLNREQYGSRPLFVGENFASPVVDVKTKTSYGKGNGKYVVTNLGNEYVYDSDFTGLFPRMWSSSHAKQYKQWSDFKGVTKPFIGPNGEKKLIRVPTFFENVKYTINYQIGFMYMRYFMWNFVGRQNDIQSNGETIYGSWISGIPFIDNWRLGSQDNIPDVLKNNEGRNKYYFLPFLLGLIGLIFHFKKDKKDAWIVTTFFILTGLAIVAYLNQYPLQPRERDYAYAGSFYAFAIWIGIGVMALIDYAKQKNGTAKAIGITAICLVLVPGLMASENWDDHDRSDRYTTLAYASNYLNSCAPNAVIFTNGDNDTFPLWYAQEVEGVRTDVRVINMSLLGTDWYIDQMKCKMYESAPVPVSMVNSQYVQGTRDMVYVLEKFKDYKSVKSAVDFALSDDPRTKLPYGDDQLDFIPTKKLFIPVDVDKVIANGTVKEEQRANVVDTIKFELKEQSLSKGQLFILDLLANFNWERPIYFVSTAGESDLGLSDYLQLDGFAWRLVPIKTTTEDFSLIGRIEPDILYDNLVNKFSYGNMDNPDVLMDYYHLRTLSVLRLRNKFARLANEYSKQGNKAKALEVLHFAEKTLPVENVPHTIFSPALVDAYFNAGDNERAEQLALEILNHSKSKLYYYSDIKKTNKFASFGSEIQLELSIMQELVKYGNDHEAKYFSEAFMDFKELYDTFYN